MRVVPLKKPETTYSCNSYLILGDWNRVGDLNTLIDPGTDGFVINEIERLSTGVGKIPVEQIILTHGHFDHAGGVAALKRRYGAKVLAFSPAAGVDGLLRDGQILKAGDGFLRVFHIPCHSSDSVCLYAPSARAMFSGDNRILVARTGGVFIREYSGGPAGIGALNIETVYPGHDTPFNSRVQETARASGFKGRIAEGRRNDPVFVTTSEGGMQC